MQVDKAENYIREQLARRLDPTLFYHGLHHVSDVTKVALEIAALEGITDPETLDILKTAALFHDSGFMNTYQGHEEEGCRIVHDVLPGLGYNAAELDEICGLIMATKIPQNPQTHLERVIADADLDYLGREDFEPISATLYKELVERGLAGDIDSWNRVQVRFFETHQYWTNSERNRRNALKAAHLERLKSFLSED